MKFSDIFINHLYYVDFDPVRNCEFNGKHLSLVLKKKNDNQTLIVIPLTKSSNGDGVNKLNIGRLDNLPNNLKAYNSYAVYNQVRTVNCSRFYALKDDDNNRIELTRLQSQIVSLLNRKVDYNNIKEIDTKNGISEIIEEALLESYLPKKKTEETKINLKTG